MTCLYSLELADGSEHLVADPWALRQGEVPAAEQVRRERSRELATGITGYAADRDVRFVTFALGGRLYSADLEAERFGQLSTFGPVVEARPNPSGSAIAYVSDGSLRVVDRDGFNDRELLTPESPDITYGLPEHVAAEEMGRHRGFWWSPAGDELVVARVDNARVNRWYLADPSNPAAPPREIRYPIAGTPNADVSLWLVDLAGRRAEVVWDRAAFEYLTAVTWDAHGLLIVVQNRAQTAMRVLAADPKTGDTRQIHEDRSETWIDIVPGLPAHLDNGGFVWTADIGSTRHLLVNGETVTPPALQIREVLDVDANLILFSASTDPTEVHLWTWTRAEGAKRVTESRGIHRGRRAFGTTVIASEGLEHHGLSVTTYRGKGRTATIATRAETPEAMPKIDFFVGGEEGLNIAVLLPRGHTGERLPVIMDPYGGPAGQRVVAASSAFLVSQWFADQGFAVVVADGRGTPGRGPAWTRTIHLDAVGIALEDQLAALRAASERYPQLDTSRVGIRGWSAGGTLAALAVLQRPDVFHAGIAGACVADQGLASTHWQERYLGHPSEHPDVYRRRSPVTYAAKLSRPLMLIHGLADDNVLPAHTLRLSAALMSAGRSHSVLLLGATGHLPTAESVVENLLLLEADFFKRSL